MEYPAEHDKSMCLECGNRIEYGRPDKKFCCETCKNKFNNRKARNSRAARHKVLAALEKNYEILKKLLNMDRTSASVAELRQLGFNFDYVTSYHKVRRHDEFACFDISFIVIASRVTEITHIVTPCPAGRPAASANG